MREKPSGWNLYGISIAFVVHSLDHSLSTRLIPLGHLEAGARCAPYKCTFQTSFKGVVQEGVEVIVNSSTLTKPLNFSIQLDSNLGYNKCWVPAKRQNSGRQNRELTVVQ